MEATLLTFTFKLRKSYEFTSSSGNQTSFNVGVLWEAAGHVIFAWKARVAEHPGSGICL